MAANLRYSSRAALAAAARYRSLTADWARLEGADP